MAISQDIRIQYANSINKNIRAGVGRVGNDNENDQQATKLISDNIASLTTLTSRIVSIIRNQILFSRFEYKENARIQKEINAETSNINVAAAALSGDSGPGVPSLAGPSLAGPSLAGVIDIMFDDLTERVQALADAASTACPGTGIGGGVKGRGSRTGTSGKKTGTTLLDKAAIGAAAVGTGYMAASAFGLYGAYQNVYGEQEPKTVPEQTQPIEPAPVPVSASEPTQVTAPPATTKKPPTPQAAITKDATGQEFVSKQGSDVGYKLSRTGDSSTSIDFTQETKVSANKTSKPTTKTPSIPVAKKAAPAPVVKSTPASQRPAQTTSYKWPALFTGVAASISSAISNFNKGLDQGYQKLSPAGSSQNAGIAMEYFISQGWSREQAAGIVGNLQQESTKYLDPNVTNQIGMYGIAQWDTSRRGKFQQLYKKPIYGSTLQDQLQYIQWELTNSHKRAGKMLRGAMTAEQAARIVQNHYEVAPGQNDNQRISNALALAGQDTAATKTGRALGNVSQVAADFYQKVVGEVTEYVTGKPKNLTFDAGVNLSGMKPGFLKKFYSAVQDYGGPVKVTSAYRSDAYQAQLWVRGNIFGERGIYTPSKPRTTQTITYRGKQFTVTGSGKGSRHLMGLAVDISRSTNRGALDPYLRKYGLHRSDPVGDPPHVQQIGGPSMDSGGSIDKPDPGGKNVKSNSKAASVNPPGQPGWSLYNPSTDKPSATIQERRINQYTKDAFKQQPNILIQKLPSSPSVTMGVKGGSGSGTSNRGGRDVSIDYKRGFGL